MFVHVTRKDGMIRSEARERGPTMDRRQNVSDACDRIEPNADVIFSLADDFVWASWPGTDSKVRLGRCAGVTAMMRDFLAQCELADRLTNDGRQTIRNAPH